MDYVRILPNSVFVTAASNTPRVCNLNDTWATTLGPGTVTVRDVVCYKVNGLFTPSKWFLSYAT